MNFNYSMSDTNSLREIAKITDQDFGLEPKSNEHPATTRLGARGIVLDDKGRMAVIHKVAKNEYKLPGGGIDDGETPAEASLMLKENILAVIGSDEIEKISEVDQGIKEKQEEFLKAGRD